MPETLVGLKSIKKYNDDQEAAFQARKAAAERGKAEWFRLGDGESAKLIFLQELDDSAQNYSAKNGLGFLAIEHSNPDAWRNSAVCTADEGACYACEQGWRQKTVLYINVLDVTGDEPVVKILSAGNGPSAVTPSLIEIAHELGTVTDKVTKVKRAGEGKKTSYTLTQLAAHEYNLEDYEVYDLKSFLRIYEYDKQEEVYNRGLKSTAEVANSEGWGVPDSPSDIKW